MRKVSIVIAACFVLALVISVTGQEKTLPATMQAINPVWASLQMNLSSSNAAGVATDAAKLQSLFADAQMLFEKEKIAQAATWSKEVGDAAGAAAKAAKGGTVDQGAKAAIGKCKQCHDMYREKDATTGAFKLKKQ